MLYDLDGQMAIELADASPEGFKISHLSDDVTVFVYRSTGMGAIMIFIAFVLSAMIIAVLNTPPGDFASMAREIDSVPMALFAVGATAMGIIAWVYFACFFFFHLIGKTVFTFSPNALEVSKRFWLFRRNRRFDDTDVRAVRKVVDGGEGEDSFPSCGLELILNEKATLFSHKTYLLLSRQQPPQCDWLGYHLSSHFSVDYNAS